jgi:acyl-CoA synthetase (AMP-forming)/AMP-acid ligase II
VSTPADAQTILQALAFWAERTPDAVALLSPDRSRTTYAGLHEAVTRFAAALGALGLGRRDAIAVVLPEGLELCVALLGAMSMGIAVPLAWPGPEPEYRRVLAMRRVRAVVAAAEAADAVNRAAGSAVPVITASGSSGRIGNLQVRGSISHCQNPVDLVAPEDVTVILRSSGTTGRPKFIPRTHQNVASFCRDFIEARTVTPADRGLSLARTISSQGLHILATTIFAGSSLALVPALERRALRGWLREQRPTYLSTTPAMLRALAAERGALQDAALRCVFATSAPLLAEEAERLESALAAPILNMYGLTEATAIAGEHYPREHRVPGSVGPAWCNVQVISGQGERLGANEIGEIVVRGPRVSPGYVDDPDLTASAFLAGGWFRTGDLGFLDEMGYVHLRGRLSEIVNRGGEKIDPGEVDAVLRACPPVEDAATFAVPDTLLGEDIVAAVVLEANSSATARQLRAWVLDHLLPYKSPRRIWFVDDLPRTETGKVRRDVLRERFLSEVGA